MQITELGLRPCLIEGFPISATDELEAIDKAEKKISQATYLKRRKNRLAAILKKTDVASLPV